MAKEKTTEEPTADPGVLVKTAKDRIAAAIKDRNPNGLTGVPAGDVIEVASAIQADKRGAVVEALLKGASAVPSSEVWCKTEHLLHLLEKVG